MHRNTRMIALRVCTLVVENAQHSSDDLTHICQSLSDSSMLQPWARSCRCMVPCYTLGCRKGRPAVNMSACTPHLESQTLPEPQPKHDGRTKERVMQHRGMPRKRQRGRKVRTLGRLNTNSVRVHWVLVSTTMYQATV